MALNRLTMEFFEHACECVPLRVLLFPQGHCLTNILLWLTVPEVLFPKDNVYTDRRE